MTECWICYETDGGSPSQKHQRWLKGVCRCRGSVGRVHVDCFLNWLNHSRSKICNRCLVPYTLISAPKLWYQVLASLPGVDYVLAAGLLVGLLALVSLGLSLPHYHYSVLCIALVLGGLRGLAMLLSGSVMQTYAADFDVLWVELLQSRFFSHYALAFTVVLLLVFEYLLLLHWVQRWLQTLEPPLYVVGTHGPRRQQGPARRHHRYRKTLAPNVSLDSSRR
jgi:hypothetical protein